MNIPLKNFGLCITHTKISDARTIKKRWLRGLESFVLFIKFDLCPWGICLAKASDNYFFFDYLIQKSPPQGIFWPSDKECLRNDQTFWKKFPRKHIIKMNTKTVHELRSIAREKGLRGIYKFKKAELLVLLLE